MFFHEWNILAIDDDPDVLAVTRLAILRLFSREQFETDFVVFIPLRCIIKQ